MQYWEISSRTCKHLPPEEQEVYDAVKQTMTVKVCDTYAENKYDKTRSRRRKRATKETNSYLHKETMFILSVTKASIYNSPPLLDCQTEVNIMEDSGTLHYQLSALDEEGDPIIFNLLNQSVKGQLSLSSDGFLVYTPCLDCSGNETIGIMLTENQTNPEIPAASTKIAINIHIQSINDPPSVFLTVNGSSLLNKDPTEDVVILLEAVNDFISNETRHWKARLGAYDVEKTDTLKFVMSNPLNLNISITEESNQLPQLLKYCNISDKLWPTMMPCAENFSDSLPHAASDLTWLTYVVQFTQPRNQFGNYTFNFYFEDSSNGTSSPVNIKFGIMEMPCHNSGTCQAKGIFPCNDTHRTHSFDAYYRCQCSGGYQGRYCREDINECLSDPCEPPFVCYNNQNSYHCACPPENPNCEIVTWMIVVSVFIVIFILVLIGVAVYRYRTQRGKEYLIRRNTSTTSIPSLLDFTDSHQEHDHNYPEEGEEFFNMKLRYVDQEKTIPWAFLQSKSNSQPFVEDEYDHEDFSEDGDDDDDLPCDEDDYNESFDMEHDDDDQSFIHPPPNLSYPSFIEMQNLKYYQSHRKTTFEPLVPTASDQDQPLTTTERRHSLRNRRVSPSPHSVSTIVSAGPHKRKYINESVQCLQDIQDEKDTSNDETNEMSPTPKKDSMDNGIVIDPDHLTPKPAWNTTLDTSEEQSEV
ncbi:uncharacterized protein LOC134275049, partial [Saccostrea cucullata]|uniref:uncharacterized protein LOC134275049 n=1 Tax=Saccostrea cuccullata TaxID=36930 RepID=UPI002ED50399